MSDLNLPAQPGFATSLDSVRRGTLEPCGKPLGLVRKLRSAPRGAKETLENPFRFATQLRALLRGAVEPLGDYYERLGRGIESSAPLCGTRRC